MLNLLVREALSNNKPNFDIPESKILQGLVLSRSNINTLFNPTQFWPAPEFYGIYKYSIILCKLDNMTLSETKSPGWMRLAQIGLGIVAIILSLFVLAFPGLTLVTIAFLLGVILFVVGIERVITGLFLQGKHRWTNIGLGVLVIILSIISMVFPVATGIFLLIFLAFVLLFDGISRVIHGIADKSSDKPSRIFSIVAGVISIVLSIMIIASPFLGAVFISILLSISLLIVGIQMITSGVLGRRLVLKG